jgi:hypothetical protein
MASFDANIETDARLITLHFAPLPDPDEVSHGIHRLWSEIPAIETYDFINDFLGMTHAPQLENIRDNAEFWSDFLQDHDAFQITALVINDPDVRAQTTKFFRELYPQRYIGAFATLQEARDWICTCRHSYLAVKGGVSSTHA